MISRIILGVTAIVLVIITWNMYKSHYHQPNEFIVSGFTRERFDDDDEFGGPEHYAKLKNIYCMTECRKIACKTVVDDELWKKTGELKVDKTYYIGGRCFDVNNCIHWEDQFAHNNCYMNCECLTPEQVYVRKNNIVVQEFCA